MKNLMMILFAMLLITMIGCDNKSSSREYVTGEQSTELPVSTSEQLKETKTTSNPEHFETSKNEALLSSDLDSSITDNSVIEEKETATASISGTDNTHEHQSTAETEKITTEPETSVTSDSDTETTVKSEWTPKVYASAGNAEEISTLVVKYINDYRAEQGVGSVTQLPGLTEYAEHRSVQLVSNYAHDTDDERAAATALKYGRYIDPSLYGISGEPYYTSEAREALAFTGKVGTVDEVAKHIATMIRNSSGHWAYVGGSEYVYVGVGITYESGYWYCDIAMSRVNNG